MAFDDSARLIWTLGNSGIGTTISGSGNSGPYTAASLNDRTAVDLRRADDLALMVYVTGITSAPTLKVMIDGYDDEGNLFPSLGATANITGTGAAAPVYIGRHGGASGNYVVVPEWGRVSWTCTGGTCTGVGIALYTR